MRDALRAIVKSWLTPESPLNCTEELIDWVRGLNEAIAVSIAKIPLTENGPWFYDPEEGTIHNQEYSFFTITGCQKTISNRIVAGQPMILQSEIGYLGIICKEFEGVMHFLMQAKIEPGNVNKIQISPTIQATKSNFTQKHGGKKPAYLEYFLNARRHDVIVDQIQSEQSSRFYKKRNRNILLHVNEEIPLLPTHRWMTLGQIKRLMREDNLVNMDTRTVLSCIPYAKLVLSQPLSTTLEGEFHDRALFRSIFIGEKAYRLPQVYQKINDLKMFSESAVSLVPLYDLRDWSLQHGELVCESPSSFKVILCDITIEGREVTHWTQPLIEAVGSAVFGLICCEDNGILKFLVKVMPELGCFDGIELGPSIQREAISQSTDLLEQFFMERLKLGTSVVFDHMLSEEGGRFYHEQNRNVLLRMNREELPKLPEGYFLLDYCTLNELTQVNNVLNIQLRNLLSLLEA